MPTSSTASEESVGDPPYASVAEAVSRIQPHSRRWPLSNSAGAGPLGPATRSFLDTMEQFVHVLSEGDEVPEAAHGLLVSTAWVVVVDVVTYPALNRQDKWNPRYGAALHQLGNWLNSDYSLQTTLSWFEGGTFEQNLDDNWARVDASLTVTALAQRLTELEIDRPEIPSGATYLAALERLAADTTKAMSLPEAKYRTEAERIVRVANETAIAAGLAIAVPRVRAVVSPLRTAIEAPSSSS
jgi:hypothetical protein